MKYRNLGHTGLKLSSLVLGTANFADPTPEDEAAEIVKRAVDAGINLIDTGDNYAAGECERYLGRILKKNGLRNQVLLGTKVHFPMGPGPNDCGNSRHHIHQACDDSLRRLNTDHIDIYQIHRPDPNTDQEETLDALNDLVRWGKVRYIACSTHPAWKVMEALAISEHRGFARYCLEQPPYNLLDRRIENELVPLCLEKEVGIIAWCPMAQGMLTGRYNSATDYPKESRAALRGGIYAERICARGIEIGEKFVALAGDAGISPVQLAVLWVKDQPGITAPIIGPRTLAHLEDLLPVGDMKLDEHLRQACDELVPPGSVAADFHNSAAWMKMQVL